MNYRKLGNSDLDVSTICLGTMTWGEQNSQEEGFEQMDYALDQGINFFDAAEMYPSPCRKETCGETEKVIGNWFKEKKKRDKVILATKISGPGMSYIRGGGPQYTEEKISEAKKNYILLTNAPRPNNIVKIFLEKMGMNKNMRENVYTSGEAALSYLKKNFLEQSFYHIGPPRDFDLFIDFKNKKTQDISKSNYLLCTGLNENHDQDLNYYKELLANSISKKMICTNPDLIVDRGEKREYCAGSVAMVFEKLGGKVVYFGKPYPSIYNFCIKKNETVLAIGDNIRTDIKGANNMKFDSLF